MNILKKLTCMCCAALLASSTIASATTLKADNIGQEKPQTASKELLEALDTNTYGDYVLEKKLKPGDEVISSKDMYYRINESLATPSFTPISEDDYTQETLGIKLPPQKPIKINSRMVNVGDPINVPDKWNWITLRMNTIKHANPQNGNLYGFTAAFNWKKLPSVSGLKDVLGLTNDSNAVFDVNTLDGQSIVFTALNPYGEVLNYYVGSKDAVLSSNGVAYKFELKASELNTRKACGYISVDGTAVSSAASITVTYGHQQAPGWCSVSIGKGPIAISISPAYSYDTISYPAGISF